MYLRIESSKRPSQHFQDTILYCDPCANNTSTVMQNRPLLDTPLRGEPDVPSLSLTPFSTKRIAHCLLFLLFQILTRRGTFFRVIGTFVRKKGSKWDIFPKEVRKNVPQDCEREHRMTAHKGDPKTHRQWCILLLLSVDWNKRRCNYFPSPPRSCGCPPKNPTRKS